MKFKKILSLLCITSLFFCISINTFAAETSSVSTDINDLADLSVKNQENIVLLDENNNILNEFHSDGYTAEFQYVESLSRNANHKVLQSIVDSDGVKQVIYANDNETISKIDFYKNNAYIGTKNFQNNLTTNNAVPYAAYSVFYVYHEDGTKTNMSNLISNTKFIRQKTSATQSDIQNLFNDTNSPLKNKITIYKKNNNNVIYNTGVSITPAKVIYDASVTYSISPKVILATLQKESSLVSAYHTNNQTSIDQKVFWFCMGAGSTSSTNTTGFEGQIKEGTRILKKWYDDGDNYSFPYNYSNSGFRGYRGYNTTGYLTNIWCDNKATYSLYKYTPYTCYSNDIIDSCNVLFLNVYNMKMFDGFPD